MPKFPPAVWLSACLAACSAAHAADAEPIVTDRPDFVESSAVVGKGRLQLETSVAVERDRNDGARERTTSTPTLLRIGVSDTVELRVETDGRVRYRLDDGDGHERLRGAADTAVGFKWHALDENGAMPAVGVLLHADVDSGSKPFRGDGVRPSLRVAAEWELPGDVGVGLMPGIVRERAAGGGHVVTGLFAVVVGKNWTEQLRTFVELAAPRIAHGKDGGSEATFDVGASWLVNRDCQVDAMLSRGLNSRTPDVAFTVGLSMRL